MFVLTASVFGCNLVDDQPPDQPVDTDGPAATCVELAQITADSCVPPESLVSDFNDLGGTVIQVDDPEASVGIGPNAWLVSVTGSADWVGSSVSNGVSCTFGCGYCPPGQSLCHGGLDDAGVASCFLCFEDDGSDPVGVIEACTNFVANNCEGSGLDETGGDETGGGDTGGDDGGGVDESGDGGGFGDTDGVVEYDCANWNPQGAVTLDARGTATVDRVLVQEIAIHFGDPLAICDGTVFGQTSDGSFAVNTMATSGLLSQVGLLPGDRILSINSKPMDSLDTIASTAIALFLNGTTTSGFSMMIGRGRTTFEKRVLIQ